VNNQNIDLKKVIANENSMGEVVDQQKKEIEDEIASVNSYFMKELYAIFALLFVTFAETFISLSIFIRHEYEVLMAKSSARFSSAPREYVIMHFYHSL